MSKRFTETNKWKDTWFTCLSDNNKLFWFYLLDNCNQVGIWEPNWSLVKFYIKDFNFKPELYNERIVLLPDGKFFIPKFLSFQYGTLKRTNPIYISINRLLEKYSQAITPLLPGLGEAIAPAGNGNGNGNGINKDVIKETEPDSDDGFTDFWEAYPKKVAKGSAVKAWEKHTPPLAKCLETLSWQKRSPDWNKDEGKFIPHPATWINARRWEDVQGSTAAAPAPPPWIDPDIFEQYKTLKSEATGYPVDEQSILRKLASNLEKGFSPNKILEKNILELKRQNPVVMPPEIDKLVKRAVKEMK